MTQRIKVLPQTYTQAQWVTAVLDANHELKLAQTQAQQQHAVKQHRKNEQSDEILTGCQILRRAGIEIEPQRRNRSKRQNQRWLILGARRTIGICPISSHGLALSNAGNRRDQMERMIR